MNHLNYCVHWWHCASGSCKDYLLLCSNHILLHNLNRLYLQILNTVAYRDLENGSLVIGQRQGYMPHECSWGRIKVPFLFICCLHDQFRSVSFNEQGLKLWILFTAHTSMAYNTWEWQIDHWLIKSTWHSLPSWRRPSTIVCRSGKQVNVEFHQSLGQEVEHNLTAIQESLIIQLIMHT